MGYPICDWDNTSDLAINERRADLDWLRVIAFWLLIYFHAAIAFVPGGIPMIQNAEVSPVLQVMVGFLHEFRLALLFLISGGRSSCGIAPYDYSCHWFSGFWSSCRR
jgi:hypothetical protein